ncbi:MAG: hypothetical protein ACOCXQ_01250 [Patescibacteria group bacterium]
MKKLTKKKKLLLVLIILILAGSVGAFFAFRTINQSGPLTTGTRATVRDVPNPTERAPIASYPVTCSSGPTADPKITFHITDPLTNLGPNSCKLLSTVGPDGQLQRSSDATYAVQWVSSQFIIENKDSVAHEVTYSKLTFVCPEPLGTAHTMDTGEQFPVCIGNGTKVVETVTVPAGGKHIFEFRRDSHYEAACGSFQNDVEVIAIDGNTFCDFPAPHDRVGIGGGQCHTGIDCTTAPTITPRPPGAVSTCGSMVAEFANGGTARVSSATSNNTITRTPAPGETVTLRALPGNDHSYRQTFWMRPKNMADGACTFWIPDADASARFTAAGEIQFTMPDWQNSTVTRNDQYGRDNNCGNTSLDFSQGVVFGVNYLPKTNSNDDKWCRQFGPGPGNQAVAYKGATSTGENCTNVCVVQTQPGTTEPTKPPQEPTTPPQQPTTPPDQPKSCGASQCDPNNPNACASGLNCIQANNGTYFCSKPEFAETCQANPSTQTCCNPQPTDPPQAQPTKPPQLDGCGAVELIIEDCTCGTECDPDLGEGACTDPDNQCIRAVDGKYYCAKTQFQNTCQANPAYETCCAEPTKPPQEPTNTPVPSPTPLPTSTPLPTFTPIPAATPLPTFTPIPPPPARVEQLPAPSPQTIVEQEQVPVIQEQPQAQTPPTYTPVPPPPTFTPLPTYTLIPTQPPQPTFTPQPLPEAGNPVPWIIAGVPVVLMLLGMIL